MRALWLEDGRIDVREDYELAADAGDELDIGVLRAGICHTDVELSRGYYPFQGVLGHEFVGRVEAPGDAWHGQRVVGNINVRPKGCQCDPCRLGNLSHCSRRTVLGIVNRHGAFAETLRLPKRNLHVVPDSVSDEAATFVEPLAAALQIGEQIKIRGADRVLVVGAGKLGQLIAQVLNRLGCELHVVARNPRKRRRLEGLGIDCVLEEDIKVGGYDIAVDVTGNQQGFDLARRGLRPRGTLVLKSTYAGQLQWDVSALVVDEIQVIGSRCGPFDVALRLLERELIDVVSLVDATFPLIEGVQAFEKSLEPDTLKVLLRP